MPWGFHLLQDFLENKDTIFSSSPITQGSGLERERWNWLSYTTTQVKRQWASEDKEQNDIKWFCWKEWSYKENGSLLLNEGTWTSVRGCRTKAVRGKHKCHSSNGADKSELDQKVSYDIFFFYFPACVV